MASTKFGPNSPHAVKRWGLDLARQISAASYWPKFTAKSPTAIIERKDDLESAKGDEVKFDLLNGLKGHATYGDDRLEGKEEALSYFQDQVRIDQVRKAVSAGGEMSRKRTIHDVRTHARDVLKMWFAAWEDEYFFNILSGRRPALAANADSRFKNDPKIQNGLAGNPWREPDVGHMLYSGAAVSRATITNQDRMSIDVIERANTRAHMLSSVDDDNVSMNPVNVDGGEYFVCVMSPLDEYYMRDLAGDSVWSKILLAYTSAKGEAKNPIFKGGAGMINNTVLHKHSRVRRYADGGAGGTTTFSRSLFLGAQAAMVAYGTRQERGRVKWVEKEIDADNDLAIYCSIMLGGQVTQFNGRRFGSMTIDSYVPVSI